jgi:hypothetical protein
VTGSSSDTTDCKCQAWLGQFDIEIDQRGRIAVGGTPLLDYGDVDEPFSKRSVLTAMGAE